VRATPDLSSLVKEHGERRGTNSGHKAPPFLPGSFLPRSPSRCEGQEGRENRTRLVEESFLVGAEEIVAKIETEKKVTELKN